MGTIIQLFGESNQTIDVSALRASTLKGLIAPPVEDTKEEIVTEHAADPIKKMEDIIRISEYLVENGRYRDNMLFIVGINFGLRVSDLRLLRFSNLINDDFTFKTTFAVFEKKTSNTRRVKKNRYITINTAVIEAVTMYLENTHNVSLSDYLFRSESSNSGNVNEPIHRVSIDRILKGIASDLHLDMKVSTHTLRKTFGYHQMMMSNNEPRKLLLLQKMFGHSSSAQTLDYIGLTQEEMEEAYLDMNLGSKTNNYLLNSSICERDVATA